MSNKYSDRLGIFYTYNDCKTMLPIIKKSLKQLKKVSKNKVDIITSVWQPIKGNPFKEYYTLYQKKHYATLVLQILTLLAFAKKEKKYKYVSFLEHDVLYPKEYFDYPNFDTEVLTYTNGLVINKFGYFKLDYSHKKLSNFFMVENFLYQLTMNIDFAIDHFSKVLLPTLMDWNSSAQTYTLEPFHVIQNITAKYNGKYPILHVDHGDNLTNHFQWYDKSMDSIETHNSYWGNIKKYKKLFYV